MNRYKQTLLRVVVLLLIIPMMAAAQDIEERVIEHTLNNGLKLLMMERHTAPIVAPYIIFKAGAVDETSDSRGIAHMLEHMLFKGTKTIGTKDYEAEKVVLDEIDQIGDALDAERAKGARADKEKVAQLEAALKAKQEEHKQWIVRGEYEAIYSRNGSTGFNAGTSNDYTIYMVELPSNKLELWAMLESDRLKNHVLREFYTERENVMEERRMRFDTDPGGKLYEQFIATAFIAHPYGISIIGWPSDISMLNRRKAEEFFRIHYAPNNFVIVIVGDIHPPDAIQLIERYFGDIPSQPLPEAVTTVEPVQEGERRIEVEFDAEPQLMIGYHKPALPAFDDYVLDMISAALSQGRTSRLYKNLIETGIAVSADSSNGWPGARYDNLFVIDGAPRAPHTPAEFEAAVYAELEKLKTEPMEEKEFKRLLKQIDAEFIRALSSNAGMAHKLADYEAAAGTWRYVLGWRETMHRIQPEDIMRVAQTYFTKSNRTVATLVKKQVTASNMEKEGQQ